MSTSEAAQRAAQKLWKRIDSEKHLTLPNVSEIAAIIEDEFTPLPDAVAETELHREMERDAMIETINELAAAKRDMVAKVRAKASEHDQDCITALLATRECDCEAKQFEVLASELEKEWK